MAGSLRRKKRAKAASGKRTHKVGVTKNLQHGKSVVNVATVRLPTIGGDDDDDDDDDGRTAPWNVAHTLTQNYDASGLASDPNAAGKRGRNTIGLDIATTSRGGEHAKVAARALSNGDETRAILGRAREFGHSAPKRLTPKQTRIVKSLVEKHGEDLDAMALDRKLNAMQHTRGVLLRMTESWYYYASERVADNAGGGRVRVDFRAPVKRKL